MTSSVRRSCARQKEGDDIGYLRIGSFNEQTNEGLKKEIARLTNEIGADKLKGFILDLRNNPGGLLDQAIFVADSFLEGGEIVSTRGKTTDQTSRALAKPGDITNGKKVVVLINGGSASASEIVAGALQDQERATIVGTRSFGKGSVQSIFQMRGNFALKLTTQLYYTPSGRSIQGKGINPDFIVQQDVPEAERARYEIKGESSIRGHIKVNEEEQGGSSAMSRRIAPRTPRSSGRRSSCAARFPARIRARASPFRRSPRSRKPAPISASRPRRRTDPVNPTGLRDERPALRERAFFAFFGRKGRKLASALKPR